MDGILICTLFGAVMVSDAAYSSVRYSSRMSYGYSARGYYSSYYYPAPSYSRTYYGYSTYYYYYYNLYYYYRPTGGAYLNYDSDSSGAVLCQNFEANDNGTYIGYFACPLSFEPSDFTNCCGNNGAQYCCVPDNSVRLITIVAITLVVVVIVSVAGYVIQRRCIRRQTTIHQCPTTNAVSTTRMSGQPSYPTMPRPPPQPPIHRMLERARQPAPPYQGWNEVELDPLSNSCTYRNGVPPTVPPGSCSMPVPQVYPSPPPAYQEKYEGGIASPPPAYEQLSGGPYNAARPDLPYPSDAHRLTGCSPRGVGGTPPTVNESTIADWNATTNATSVIYPNVTESET